MDKKEAKETKKQAKREIRAAKEATKREVEEVKRAKKEAQLVAKEIAKREAEETKRAKKEAELTAKEQAKKEVRGAKEVKGKVKGEPEEIKKTGKEAEVTAEETVKTEAPGVKGEVEKNKKVEEKKASTKLSEGMIELVVLSPVAQGQIEKLEIELSQVQGLRLILVSGSTDKGIRLLVSTEKAIPLIGILEEFSIVERVVRKGQELQVRLKAR